MFLVSSNSVFESIMKTLILLTLFALCVVAHTPESSSEESSSSEEVIFTRSGKLIASKPDVRQTDDESESEESSSSEEVIYNRGGYEPETRRKRVVRAESKKSQYQRADHDTRWEKYKIQFNMQFPNERKELKAKRRFMKNRLKVWKHKDENQNSTIDIEMNEYAVMSSKQFKKTKMGLTP